MMRLFLLVSLSAIPLPTQAETIYLLIKAENGSGLALHSIPIKSIGQCEEIGAFIIASEGSTPNLLFAMDSSA